MFGKKCTLCGGKLNSNNVCTECGLDNNKSEKRYRINSSSCDGMPLTHVHEEAKTDRRRKIAAGKPRNVSKPKKKGKKKLVVVLAVLVIVITGFEDVSNFVWDMVAQLEEKTGIFDDYNDYDETAPYDPYQDLTQSLPEEGETAEYVLESGTYIVGVHIPPGNYRAETQDDFDTVQTYDRENGIYLYEYKGKGENNYLDDLRLFEGARVTIVADYPVKMSTQNAQTSVMNSMENPLTGVVTVEDAKTKRAGKDFEAGVYDLQAIKGTGTVEVFIYNENGEEYSSDYIFLSESGQNRYRNLVLPQNAEITLQHEEKEDVNFEVTLTPSEIISSTDYMEYYIY